MSSREYQGANATDEIIKQYIRNFNIFLIEKPIFAIYKTNIWVYNRNIKKLNIA